MQVCTSILCVILERVVVDRERLKVDPDLHRSARRLNGGLRCTWQFDRQST